MVSLALGRVWPWEARLRAGFRPLLLASELATSVRSTLATGASQAHGAFFGARYCMDILFPHSGVWVALDSLLASLSFFDCMSMAAQVSFFLM